MNLLLKNTWKPAWAIRIEFSDNDDLMNVIFITYNGLTSHIGRAQVFPYLSALSRCGHTIHIISCEPHDIPEHEMSDAREAVAQAGLHWHPLHYSSLPGPLSKIMDSISLSNAVRELAKSVSDIDIVHCRSYVPADAALFLKHKYGAKFIFDMRGLWPDQRAEGNRWPQTSLLYRLLYRWWKKKEGNYIRQSDAIISLTDACKSEIKKWGSYNGCPIPVIPCSVDIDEFDVVCVEQRTETRRELNIAPQTPVFTYLGSLGSVYLLDDMIRSFAEIKKRLTNAVFLLVGHSADDFIDRSRELGITFAAADVISRRVTRSEVPALLNAADVGFCFIKSSYSSIGVSPTKLGEYLACGLPVICNSGVGDVKEIVDATRSGVVLEGELETATIDRLEEIVELLTLNRNEIRARSIPGLDLGIAVESYDALYRSFALVAR